MKASFYAPLLRRLHWLNAGRITVHLSLEWRRTKAEVARIRALKKYSPRSIMPGLPEFVHRYFALFNAEYRRIGLTDDDLKYLGSGGELTEESLAASLEQLRRIPSGIGAQAYFARYWGIDWAARKRQIEERASRSGP